MKYTTILPALTMVLIHTAFTFSIDEKVPDDRADAENKVEWISIEEAVVRVQKVPRPVVVFVQTDTCGWCKKMMQDAFANPSVATYINNNYHPVLFDAEFKNDIVIGGQTYRYVPSGRRGYHELAAAMTNRSMKYPTTVFFDERLQIIAPIPGFRRGDEMLAILYFFKDKVYLSNPDLDNYISAFINRQ